MLKDIIKQIDSAIPSLFPVNAAQFNDPVAFQTEWKGSIKIRRRFIIHGTGSNLLAYKPSMLGVLWVSCTSQAHSFMA